MRIRTWKSFIKEGFKNVVRNRVMSLASISAIMATLFVLGIVVVIIMNINNVVAGLESKVEVTVFLKKDAGRNDIMAMEDKIKSWDGINSIEFISKAQALETWREEWGDKRYLLDGYNSDNNPLPDSFLIRVDKPGYVDDIVSKAKSMILVEKVQFSKDVVDVIGRISTAARLIGLFIVLLLTAMAMVIISNTIKLTVYSRRREINIMKYIGATDWYIRWPFIVEGLVIGLAGALFTGALIAGIYTLILGHLDTAKVDSGFLSMFKLLPLDEIIYPTLVIFIIVGSIVGISASMLSIRKHLKV